MRRYILYIICLLCLTACDSIHVADEHSDALPQISPDYASITLPANIAPINFEILEEGDNYQVEIGAEDTESIFISSSDGVIQIDEKQWHTLLDKAKGKTIFIRVLVEKDGRWIEYHNLHNRISNSNIDGTLVYRLIYPGYEFWREMGIYQRDLTTFRQTSVIENKDIEHQCVNCHSFAGRNPETMMLHVRGKQGGTVISKGGTTQKVNPQPESYPRGATYPYWSDDGKFIVFSSNDVHQYFHQAGPKKIEVSDLASDLFVYDVEKNEAFTDPLVFGDDALETFPTFSPDGKTIYFCRAAAYHEGEALDSIRYGLYAIDLDAKSRRLSNLRCLVNAPETGHSISFPRVSPDGRWLVYTRSDYGNFSIWHSEADLWIMDLTTGDSRCMKEICSDEVESYHSWSSDGEWIVFSSKRMDGLWARPFIAHFDPKSGKASRPFLLPQEDPRFYDDFTLSYNIPELAKGKVTAEKDILKAIKKQEPARATAK